MADGSKRKAMKTKPRTVTNAYVMEAPPAGLARNLGHVAIPIWGDVPGELDKLIEQGFGKNRAEAYYWLAMAELRRLLDQRHEREMRRR